MQQCNFNLFSLILLRLRRRQDSVVYLRKEKKPTPGQEILLAVHNHNRDFLLSSVLGIRV